MSTLLVVNGAPYGSELPSEASLPAEALWPHGVAGDDLVEGVRPTAIHDPAATAARSVPPLLPRP